jgi:DNA-directed RNA polymerase specialized sigma54-like protein
MHPKAEDRVDSEPFKRAFERSEMTGRELAKIIGCDERSVRRMMKGKWVSYDRGVLMARAFGLDPVDVGV